MVKTIRCKKKRKKKDHEMSVGVENRVLALERDQGRR